MAAKPGSSHSSSGPVMIVLQIEAWWLELQQLEDDMSLESLSIAYGCSSRITFPCLWRYLDNSYDYSLEDIPPS